MSKLVMRVTSGPTRTRLIESLARFIDRDDYAQHFVFLNDQYPDLAARLRDEGFDTTWIEYNGWSDLPLTIWKLRGLIKNLRPSIVHTHFSHASIAGLTAGKLAGIKGRVHTRHHGIECHEYYPHAVYYDRYINRLSRRIMATSNVVREILVTMEDVPPEKISVINHGFDFTNFESDPNRSQALREKYGLVRGWPTIGVVSRFVEWKGIQYIIPAFAELKRKFRDARLVLANAQGSFQPEIDRVLRSHLDTKDFVCIPFEPHIFDLYPLFDVFVHVPIGKFYEALGQIYIEALYSRIPSVFTMSGVANDFIENEHNALVVPFKDSKAIFEAIERLLSNADLRDKVIRNGFNDVVTRFGGERLRTKVSYLYELLDSSS